MRVFRAPGRVNLIGDHTDYNEGFVLPIAIDRECVVHAAARSDGIVRVTSTDREGYVEVPADGGTDPGEVQGWGAYVAGVVRALAERGRPPAGIDAVVSTTIPIGAGLSSSAAFEVALALALCDAASFQLPAVELALACQQAEQIATGVPSGIMDQLSSIGGRPGCALLIDCRTLEVSPVLLPPEAAVLVVYSGVSRSLADTAYAERRRTCDKVAARLGLPALRDATPEQIAGHRWARHVVSENARVLEAARALEDDDLSVLGRLLSESHASLRDDYDVSTPELDALTAALEDAGAAGARLTGAGFGGCVVAVADRADAEGVAARATARYRAQMGLRPAAFLCRAVAGAGRVNR